MNVTFVDVNVGNEGKYCDIGTEDNYYVDTIDIIDNIFNDIEALADYIRSLNNLGGDLPKDVDAIMRRIERVALDEEDVESVWGEPTCQM